MHELKFTSPNQNAEAVVNYFDAFFNADGDYSKNIITSLYFDTLDWDFAMEKASSDFLKSKIRLRYYEDSETGQCSPCFLEVKQKTGAVRFKKRFKLEEIDVSRLNDATYTTTLIEIVQQSVAGLEGLTGEWYYPSIFVRYLRNRYIEPLTDSRVAIDRNITCKAHVSRDIKNRLRLELSSCVMELKGEERALLVSMESLTTLGFRPEAFSKYYLSYCALFDYEQ